MNANRRLFACAWLLAFAGSVFIGCGNSPPPPTSGQHPSTGESDMGSSECSGTETITVGADIVGCSAAALGLEGVAWAADLTGAVVTCTMVISGETAEAPNCTLSLGGVLHVIPYAACMSLAYNNIVYPTFQAILTTYFPNTCIKPPVEPLPSHGGQIYPGEDCTDVCATQASCMYCTTGYCSREGECGTQPNPTSFPCTPNGSSQADCPNGYICFPEMGGYYCYPNNSNVGTPALPALNAPCTPRTTGPYAGVPYYGNCPEPLMCTPASGGSWTCVYPSGVSPPASDMH